MKSLITKLVAVICIAILTVGCASSITAPEQMQEKEQIKKEAPSNDITGETDMRSNRPRPKV